jgi:hypothetical protein
MFFPRIRNFPPAPLFLLHRILLYNPSFLTLGVKAVMFATQYPRVPQYASRCKDRRMKQVRSLVGVPTYVLETPVSSVNLPYSGHFRATT